MKVHQIVELLLKTPQDAEFIVQHYTDGVNMCMPDTASVVTVISGEITAKPKTILVDTPIPGIPYWRECEVTPISAVVLSVGAPETHNFK